jgi:hypothetical protein
MVAERNKGRMTLAIVPGILSVPQLFCSMYRWILNFTYDALTLGHYSELLMAQHLATNNVLADYNP